MSSVWGCLASRAPGERKQRASYKLARQEHRAPTPPAVPCGPYKVVELQVSFTFTFLLPHTQYEYNSCFHPSATRDVHLGNGLASRLWADFGSWLICSRVLNGPDRLQGTDRGKEFCQAISHQLFARSTISCDKPLYYALSRPIKLYLGCPEMNVVSFGRMPAMQSAFGVFVLPR